MQIMYLDKLSMHKFDFPQNRESLRDVLNGVDFLKFITAMQHSINSPSIISKLFLSVH